MRRLGLAILVACLVVVGVACTTPQPQPGPGVTSTPYFEDHGYVIIPQAASASMAGAAKYCQDTKPPSSVRDCVKFLLTGGYRFDNPQATDKEDEQVYTWHLNAIETSYNDLTTALFIVRDRGGCLRYINLGPAGVWYLDDPVAFNGITCF